MKPSFRSLLLPLLLGCVVVTPATANSGFDPKTAPFVTRDGTHLMLEGAVFRFFSVNIPNYQVVEDAAYQGAARWHRVTEFEQRDAARTVALLGGRVFRVYVPSVQGGKNNPPELSHIYRDAGGAIAYNEELFRDLDRGLAIAAAEGVRVIIPLVDNWEHFGGPPQWAKLAGVRDFWDKAQARNAFQNFFSWLANRVNTVSGVRYKDDPTILCWELGNELRLATPDWSQTMSAFIKLTDPKHLIMDGGYDYVRADHLRDPNIDICTTHYTNNYLSGYAAEVKAAGKVYVYGEFEPADPAIIDTIGQAVLDLDLAGAMVWSLRFRSESGGFYFHPDFGRSDSLQYPGFAATKPDNEAAIIARIKDWAWRLQGKTAPADPLPAAPWLFRSVVGKGLAWQGSVGATAYRLEQAPAASGPWTMVAARLAETGWTEGDSGLTARLPLWDFPAGGASDKKPVWYRLGASNASGMGPFSNILKVD